MNGLFIEETLPDFSYQVVWRDGNIEQALDKLNTIESKNRLELWSKSHAESPKGFAPIAFRDKNSDRVMITNTLKMLFGESF